MEILSEYELMLSGGAAGDESVEWEGQPELPEDRPEEKKLQQGQGCGQVHEEVWVQEQACNEGTFPFLRCIKLQGCMYFRIIYMIYGGLVWDSSYKLGG